jgi:hypothetical protein
VTYLQYLLAEAMGAPLDDPRVQRAVLAIQPLVPQRRMETVEMHRRIDKLRGQGVSCADIAAGLGITRQAVTRIVASQLEARRKHV